MPTLLHSRLLYCTYVYQPSSPALLLVCLNFHRVQRSRVLEFSKFILHKSLQYLSRIMASFNNQMFNSMDMDSLQPMVWDSVLDQHMVANYNQVSRPFKYPKMYELTFAKMLQHASDFYGNLDSSTSGAASPSSDGSSPRSLSISGSKVVTEVRSAIPDKVEVS